MAWKIRFSEGAKKDLSRLDKPIAKRILSFFEDRLGRMADPRSVGECLKGERLGEFWRYRIGDWRAYCGIEDDIITIYVVRIGHRSQVYRER